MSVAGICIVLKVDLGSGKEPDINLGRKTDSSLHPKAKVGKFLASYALKGSQSIKSGRAL